MAENILDFDEGYDACDSGEAFDTEKSQSWQDGYMACQEDEYPE